MLGCQSVQLDEDADQITVRTFPAVLGFGAGLAILQGAFDYTGGKFSGYDKDPNVDEYERKEALRKNRRRPIQETLEELGEGRGEPSVQMSQEIVSLIILGIYGPGYRERRADRIKENYGIVSAHFRARFPSLNSSFGA